MKKLIILIAMLCLMTSPAHAGKDEKVNELIEIVYYNTFVGSLEQLIPQIIAPIECSFQLDKNAQKELKNETKTVLLSYTQKMSAIVKPYFEKNFTEAEVDELLSFYKSPTMQKMIDLTPVITKESFPKIQALNGEMAMQLIEATQAVAQKYPEKSTEEQQSCMQEKIGIK